MFYTILAVSIIFAACKKEDESPNSGNNTSASIVGSWDLTEVVWNASSGYYAGGYPNGTKVITDTESETITPGDTSWGIESLNWNFKENQTLIGTFVDTDGYTDIDTTIWEKNGNTLTIDTNNIFSIISLTSSNLTINIAEEDTMTDYWDTNNDTVYFETWNETIKWKRSNIIAENDNNSKLIQNSGKLFFQSFIDRKRK